MMTPTNTDTSIGHGQDETGLELSPQISLSIANDNIDKLRSRSRSGEGKFFFVKWNEMAKMP